MYTSILCLGHFVLVLFGHRVHAQGGQLGHPGLLPRG